MNNAYSVFKMDRDSRGGKRAGIWEKRNRGESWEIENMGEKLRAGNREKSCGILREGMGREAGRRESGRKAKSRE
jgi:hypothetical protein